MQAAIGVEQLKKFPAFIEERRKNWKFLKEKLDAIPGVDEKLVPSRTCEKL